MKDARDAVRQLLSRVDELEVACASQRQAIQTAAEKIMGQLPDSGTRRTLLKPLVDELEGDAGARLLREHLQETQGARERAWEAEKRLREATHCPGCGVRIMEPHRPDCGTGLRADLRRLKEAIKHPSEVPCPSCSSLVLVERASAAGFECGRCDEVISYGWFERQRWEIQRLKEGEQ